MKRRRGLLVSKAPGLNKPSLSDTDWSVTLDFVRPVRIGVIGIVMRY